ncbi:MAG: hypothetical protein HOW73_36855 [Polyangiaceae bacterium]|nr:hypothetical protein [Polyangiaceae bacterium]
MHARATTNTIAAWTLACLAGCGLDASTGDPVTGGAGGAVAGGSAPSGGGGSLGGNDGVGGAAGAEPHPTPQPGPVDEIIEQMEPGSWRALSGTPMKEVCPPPFHNYFCWSVVGAWGGATWDPNRDRMLVFGGGHADSYYNNIFAFDLGQMRWDRLTELPDGADGSQPTEAMQQIDLEPCGYYPIQSVQVPPSYVDGGYIRFEHCDASEIAPFLDDQQPRSTHTYNTLWFDAERDRFCTLGGSYYPSAQKSSPRTFCYDFGQSRWIGVADYPEASRGATSVDATGHLWVVPAAGGHLLELDPEAQAWTPYVSVNGLEGTGDIDRSRNQLVLFRRQTRELLRWDLTRPDQPHEMLPQGVDTPSLPERPGFVYADGLDRYVVWGGGRTVYFIDPADWTWSRDEATGDDPGEPQPNGTYGRFRYSVARGVFVLVNDTNQDVFLYKPTTSL